MQHALSKVDSAVAQRGSLLGRALEQSTRSTKRQVMADMCWTVHIKVATGVAVMLHQQSSLKGNAHTIVEPDIVPIKNMTSS